MRNKIINYIRAGYPGLYLVSAEEQRVALEMTRIAQELKYNLVFWSVVDGLVDTQKGTNNSANDPLEALIAIKDLKEKTLILLRDFHLFLQDPNPIVIRQLKDVLQMAKTKSKTLIILGCRMVLPIPPLPEQQEIVRRVESLFALADQIEARYAKAQAQVDKLTPSLLAKAFRGELVPQDSNDEPASVLLGRIRSRKLVESRKQNKT